MSLGSLGGSYSQLRAINNVGQVIGYSQTVEGYQRAALWSGEAPVELGSLGGNSYALGLNDAGLVVGVGLSFEGAMVAALWRDGLIVDLNAQLDPTVIAAGWTLLEAADINNSGQIVGYARNNITGLYSAYLLTPESVLPEPTALSLLVLGLMAFTVVRRRSVYGRS